MDVEAEIAATCLSPDRMLQLLETHIVKDIALLMTRATLKDPCEGQEAILVGSSYTLRELAKSINQFNILENTTDDQDKLEVWGFNLELLQPLLQSIPHFPHNIRYISQTLAFMLELTMLRTNIIQEIVLAGVIDACLFSVLHNRKNTAVVRLALQIIYQITQEEYLIPDVVQLGAVRRIFEWIDTAFAEHDNDELIYLSVRIIQRFMLMPKLRETVASQGGILMMGKILRHAQHRHPAYLLERITAVSRAIVSDLVRETETRQVINALEELGNALDLSGDTAADINETKAIHSIQYLEALLLSQAADEFLSSLDCGQVILTLCHIAASYVDQDEGKLFYASLNCGAEASHMMEAEQFGVLLSIIINCIQSELDSDDLKELYIPASKAFRSCCRLAASNVASLSDLDEYMECVEPVMDPDALVIAFESLEYLTAEVNTIGTSQILKCLDIVTRLTDESHHTEHPEIAAFVSLLSAYTSTKTNTGPLDDMDDQILGFCLETILEYCCTARGYFFDTKNASDILTFTSKVICNYIESSAQAAEQIGKHSTISTLLYAAAAAKTSETSLYCQEMVKSSVMILCALMKTPEMLGKECNATVLITAVSHAAEQHPFDVKFLQHCSEAVLSFEKKTESKVSVHELHSKLLQASSGLSQTGLHELNRKLCHLNGHMHSLCIRVSLGAGADSKKLLAILNDIQDCILTAHQRVEKMHLLQCPSYEQCVVWSLYAMNRIVLSADISESLEWDGLVRNIATTSRIVMASCIGPLLHLFTTCLENDPEPLGVLYAIIDIIWSDMQNVISATENTADVDRSKSSVLILTEHDRFFQCISLVLEKSEASAIQPGKILKLLESLRAFHAIQVNLLKGLRQIPQSGVIFIDMACISIDRSLSDLILLNLGVVDELPFGRDFVLKKIHLEMFIQRLNKTIEEGKRYGEHPHLHLLERNIATICLSFMSEFSRSLDDALALLQLNGMETVMKLFTTPHMGYKVYEYCFLICFELSKQQDAEIVGAFDTHRVIEVLLQASEHFHHELDQGDQPILLIPLQALVLKTIDLVLSHSAASSMKLTPYIRSCVEYMMSHVSETDQVYGQGKILVQRMDTVMLSLNTKRNTILDFDECLECLQAGAVWKMFFNATDSKFHYLHTGTGQSVLEKPIEYEALENALIELQFYSQERLVELKTGMLTESRMEQIVLYLIQILRAHEDSPQFNIVKLAIANLEVFGRVNTRYISTLDPHIIHNVLTTLRQLTKTKCVPETGAQIAQYCIQLGRSFETGISDDILSILNNILRHLASNQVVMNYALAAMATLEQSDVGILSRINEAFEKHRGNRDMLKRLTKCINLFIQQDPSIMRKAFETCGESLIAFALLPYPHDSALLNMALQFVETVCAKGLIVYDVLRSKFPQSLAQSILAHIPDEKLALRQMKLLRRLSEVEVVDPDPKNAPSAILMANGAAPALVKTLEYQHGRDILSKCLHTLLNVLEEDSWSNEFCRLGGVRAALHGLQHFDWDEDIIDSIVQLISFIAFSESGREAVEEAHGIETILTAFELHKGKPQLLEGLVSCLATLACSKRQLFGWENSIVPLLDIIDDQVTNEQECDFLEPMIGTITRLAVQREYAHIVCQNGLHTVLNVLSASNQLGDLVTCTLGLIWQLCYFEENVPAIMMLDTPSILLEILSIHIDDVDTVFKCIEIINTLVHLSEEYARVFIKLGTEAILVAVRSKYKKVFSLVQLIKQIATTLEDVIELRQTTTTDPVNVLENYANRLDKGHVFGVYEGGKRHLREKHIALSPDGKHFILRDVMEPESLKSNSSRDQSQIAAVMNHSDTPELSDVVELIALRNVVDITLGLGKNHKRFMFKSQAVEERCLNIITQLNTLSLECKSANEREHWADAFVAAVRLAES